MLQLQKRKKHSIKCKKRYGDKLSIGKKPQQPLVPDEETGEFVPYEDGETPPYQMPVQEATDSSGKFIKLDNILDNYINMEVCFPQGESELWGKVVGLCLDKDGKVIGSPNENPYMNTALYEVKFDDGTTQTYGANIIAKNLWRSVNDEGYHEDILHSIVGFKLHPNAVKDL